MSEHIDQRRGVPSASGMDRIINCPPSFEMEKLAPDMESEAAASGTRIHSVLALEAATDTLKSAETETFEMCLEQASALTGEWAGTEKVIGTEATHRERRLGMTPLGRVLDVTPECKAEFIFTGQADLILVKDGRALVIDYKTGRGEVPTAQDNPQLASLAVLVAGRYGVSQVRVAIVQPWAGKPTVADYGPNALMLARTWLVNALEDAKTAEPEQARAGNHCKYCRAQGRCPAFRDHVHGIVETIEPANIAGLDGETQRKAMFARAMEMPAASLAAAVNGLPMINRFVESITSAAKDRAANDPEFQRFFTVREKKGRRSISDVTKVFNACAKSGVTADAFTAACSIPLGYVKDLLRAATGAKGKALEALHEAALEGAVVVGKGSLELVPAGALEGGDV